MARECRGGMGGRAKVAGPSTPPRTVRSSPITTTPRSATMTQTHPHRATRPRGVLMPIGGHEDKSGQTDILSRFVELAGGKKARIVIIPTASTEPETGKRYPPVFRKLGVADAQLLEVPDRHYANSDEALATLREATGIFISGGDQTRLVEYLGGTLLAECIRARYDAGVVV